MSEPIANTPDESQELPEAELSAAGESLEALRGELQEAHDRALRAQAELENVRKRSRRELEERLQYAAMPLVEDLLPVVDNVARAIEAAEKTPEVGSLLSGLKIVAQQLEAALEKHHCRRIGALHQPFDPHLHQAITQQPSAEHPPGTVLLVAQAGFQMHDRVVRPSQVIVSTAPTS